MPLCGVSSLLFLVEKQRKKSSIRSVKLLKFKFFKSLILILVFYSNATHLRAQDLVLVVGGSGLTGWETVKEAINKKYNVRATTTNLKRAKDTFGESGFSWVKVDVRIMDDIRKAMDGVDYVISTIGGSCYDPGGPTSSRHIDYQGVVNLAGIAKDYGIKHFILTSSINAGIAEVKLNEFCDNVHMWKWLAEDYIRDSGIQYTIVRPGGLGQGEGGSQDIIIKGSRGLKTGFIERADVANVLVGVLGNDDAYSKTIEIVSDKDNPRQDWKKKLKQVKSDPVQASPLKRK